MKTPLMMAAAVAAIAFTAPASAQQDVNSSNRCQVMMNQADAKLPTMAEGRQKKDAQKQMDMARSSLSAQEETACIMHMKHALNDMS